MLLISGLAAFSPPLLGQNTNEDDNSQGGLIQGSEQLHANIVLVATNNAPAGASGDAKLEAEDDEGTQKTQLSVETQGLAPGDYTASIVKKSDGSTVTLGTITVSGSETNHHTEEVENDNGLQLPPGVNAMDIASIVVSDAQGNPVLVGDVLDAAAKSVVRFNATVRITPEGTNSTATGKAVMQSAIRSGRQASRFTLRASGLPPSSTLSVNVNGQNVGTIATNKKGKTLISKLPANPLIVHSVELMDSQKQVIAKAKF
jgi:hypothetical protein